MGFPRWKFEFQPKISCKPIRISLAHKFLNQTTDFVGLHRNRPCISARSTTLAPPVGLEPTTYRLTADRSTIELWRIIAYSSAIGVKFQLALHPNFDTRDDCSKRVHRPGANRVQRMRLFPIKLMGKNRGMHPHRVQLLHAEVSVHPHRVQMHPVLVHFGDYDGVS